MRKLTSVDEFFSEDLEDRTFQELYRESLEEELRHLLKELRRKRGLKQEEVARRMGVHRSRVAQMEAYGGLAMSLESLARYADALGYRLLLLFQDREGGEVAYLPVGVIPGLPRVWTVHLSWSEGKGEAPSEASHAA